MKAESSNFASYVSLGVPILMQKALSNGTENVVVSSNSVISTFKIFWAAIGNHHFFTIPCHRQTYQKGPL